MNSTYSIPNPSAAPYSAGASYLLGEYAIGTDGNTYVAVQATTGNAPTTDAGTNWILARVTNSVTLNIASRFTTFALAWAFLKQAYIDATAFVTIQFADATYAMGTSPYVLNHPCGSRIQILGNVTTPANVVLNCTMPAKTTGAYYQNNWGMFSVHSGNTIGLIDGFTVNGLTGHPYGTVGLLAFDHATIIAGPHLVINNFYAGVAAYNHSHIDCDGITVTGGGDGNVFAYNSSSISFQNGTSSGASTWYAQSGLLAEFSSTIFAPNSTISNNGLTQVQVNSGSSVNIDNASIVPSVGQTTVACASGTGFIEDIGTNFNSYPRPDGLINGGTQYLRFGYDAQSGLSNFGAFQFIKKGSTLSTISITQDGVAGAFWGFASGSSTNYLVTDGAAMTFAVGSNNTLVAGTQALKLTATKATVVKLNISAVPTSSSGLSSGDVYSNAGVLTIVP